MNIDLRLPASPEPQPKSTRAYVALREAIIAIRLPPGTVLQEREICAQLGISRTPFREAVLRLAQEGLVSVVPSDATYVNRIEIHEVIEGHLLRDAIEMRLIGLAARRYRPELDKDFELVLFRQRAAEKRSDAEELFDLDNDFHRLICATAGFPKIWSTIHGATGQLDRVRRLAYPRPGFIAEVVDEHSAIHDALRANDEETATVLMRKHLDDIVGVTRFVLDRDPEILSGGDQIADFEALVAAERPAS